MVIGKRTATLAAVVVLSLGMYVTGVSAAPMTLNLSGSVISGSSSGTWSGQDGSTFTADLTFDLDEANAFEKELITIAGEDPFYRWTFTDNPTVTPNGPYSGAFAGLFGALTTGTIWLETLDNFDADAAGNPFGVTGVVDVLSIFGGNTLVDCTGGTVHPITGCSLENAPRLSGEEFGINLIASAGWFSGDDVLPTGLTPAGGLTLFGGGEQYSGETVVGELAVDFNSIAVPEPATFGLFGFGIAGLGLATRRRKAK